MSKSNFERMMDLIDATFDVKNDPNQLDVDFEIIENLEKIHVATVTELDHGNGPEAWILIIPSNQDLINLFIEKKISEKELYERIPKDGKFDSLYLCSALVLEENRRKGIAMNLSINAIREFEKNYPIKNLFVWTFTKEGEIVSKKIAIQCNLPLFERK